MNQANVFAFIAVLALAGWTAVLVLFSRSLLPMANALSVLHKVDKLIDDRIAAVVERIRARQQRGAPKAGPQTGQTQQNTGDDELARIFGGSPIEPLGEQPDSSLEVVS